MRFEPITLRCAIYTKQLIACSHHQQGSDHKQQHHKWTLTACDRQNYLEVGVALRIEGWERRDWYFIQPLALLVRPRLIIKGNLRRFYLRCTNNAQHKMMDNTHTRAHMHAEAGKVHSSHGPCGHVSVCTAVITQPSAVKLLYIFSLHFKASENNIVRHKTWSYTFHPKGSAQLVHWYLIKDECQL